MAKYKAYPEYRDSGVEWLGEIPEKWNTYSLKRSISNCTSGLWGEEPNGKNDIIILRVADFERNSLTISSDKLTMRAISSEEREIRLLKKGDLIIEKSGGGDKTLVGCVVVFEKNFNAITSNFVAKMSPLKGYQPHFLKYCFSHLYDGKINSLSIKQTTGIQNIDINHYLMRKFCFPDEIQQRIICEFLDYQSHKFNTLIVKQKQLIELLKEKRQAVISHAVTKGLNPDMPMKDSGVEWLGQIPEHWNLIQISRLYKRIKLTGRADEELLSVYRDHGVIPKSSRDDNNNKPSDDLSQYQLVKIDDLVLNKMKAWQGSIAISKFKGIVSPAYFVYKPQNFINKLVYSKYIHHLLRNSLYITQYLCRSKGIRINQWDLDPEEFKTIPVLLPPKAEQKEIYETVDYETTKIDTLIQKQLQQIDLLKERRTALIAAAVTGKIDLRDWTPPASSTESSLADEEATA